MTLTPVSPDTCALRSDDGFVAEFEIPGLAWSEYDAINREVFEPFPPGLRMHAAYALPDAVRIVEIWASREDWEEYLRTTLAPVLARHNAPEPRVHLGPLGRAFLCQS